MIKVEVPGMVMDIINETERTIKFIVNTELDGEVACTLNLKQHNKTDIQLGQEYKFICKLLGRRSTSSTGKIYIDHSLYVEKIISIY